MSELIELRAQDRMELDDLLTQPIGAKPYQRALALILLDEGHTAAEIGEELQVSRRTIYNWVDRFEQREEWPLAARLRDAPRSGRPASVQGLIDPWLDQVIDTDPRDLGYNSTVWTAPLLRHYLQDTYHLEVSIRSIGLALGRLRIRWKMPRHVLARRDPFWRQSKGGSNGACGCISARSCSCSMRLSLRKLPPYTGPMAALGNKCACPLRGTVPNAFSTGRSTF